jgi:hypothetical protein
MLIYGLAYVIGILFLSSILNDIEIARNYKALIFYAAIVIGFVWSTCSITIFDEHMKHKDDF